MVRAFYDNAVGCSYRLRLDFPESYLTGPQHMVMANQEDVP